MKEELIKIAKDTLFFNKHFDLAFPSSCGYVSKYIYQKIHELELFKDYEVRYIRGHYLPDVTAFEEACENINASPDLLMENPRIFETKYFKCTNCTCEYSVGHSWIELIKDGDVTIVDFTSSQFHENSEDLISLIYTKDFTKEELFNEMSKFSTFFVTKEEEKFNNYVPDETVWDDYNSLNKVTREDIKNISASVDLFNENYRR